MSKTYQIYPSTIEDISNGWIWISVPDLDQRGVAKIKTSRRIRQLIAKCY